MPLIFNLLKQYIEASLIMPCLHYYQLINWYYIYDWYISLNSQNMK